MKVRTLLAVATMAAASGGAVGCAAAHGLPSARPAAGPHAERAAHAKSGPGGPKITIEASPRYYLALGDSLSTGLQPTATGGIANTDQGYANDLLAYESKYVKSLTLVQLGCPGETTTSLLTGQGNTAAAKYFKCTRAGGSQLAAALSFLKTHHDTGEVPLITIDIGANDIVPCATTANPSACVATGIQKIDTDLPKILSALRQAAPAGTRFATMNLYDPALHYELLPTTDPTQPLGAASVPLLQQVNTALQTISARLGFRVADVADAFNTYDTTTTVPWNDLSVPQNVATLCDWTWNCAPPPVGPNIHPNALGYGVIAQAFEKVVGTL